MDRRSHFLPLTIALAAQLLLLPVFPAMIQAAGMSCFVILGPGWLLVTRLMTAEEVEPTPLAQAAYATAAGYGILVFTTLILSYVPGPLHGWQLLLTLNALTVGLAIAGTRRNEAVPPGARGQLLLAVGSLVVVAGLLRLPNLGYSEFQGDEARAILRAAAVIQGYDETLMLHKKGPLEILVPAAPYAVTWHITEGAARLPFAIANLAALAGVFLLGRSLFGTVAGWSAAMLLAVDGYLIGFSRIVQYQSFVLLMTVLTVHLLYQQVEHGRMRPEQMLLAAFFMATGLLAHYETAAVLLPCVYLLWLLMRQARWQASAWRTTALALSLGAALLALFYVPYLVHPSFADTYFYLTQYRIGGRPPYNHLLDFTQRTLLYNSTYHFVAMTLLLLLALAQAYARGLGRLWRWPATVGLAVLMAGLLFWPQAPVVGGLDLTGLLAALAVGSAMLLPRQRPAERLLWIWFAPLLIVALFLVAKPRTHVYVFFVPWTLLAGMALARIWAWLSQPQRSPWARRAAQGAAMVGLLVFAGYTFQLFTYTQVEVYRTWAENRPRGYWMPFSEPATTSLFGLPMRNGWKAMGVLYADGDLVGPYETNEFDPWVTHWYTRGAERCWRDHLHLAIGDHSEPKRQAQTAALLDSISQDHRLTHTVLVNGEPRLDLYRRGGADQPMPQPLPIEPLAARFDRDLSDPLLPLDAPVVAPVGMEPLNYRLGETILLVGYRLDRRAVRPGETLMLTLFWRALGEIEEDYTVFNQLIGPDNAMYGQIDATPGCDLAPTDGWPADGIVVDAYRIPIFAHAQPGVYPLFTGMYDAEHDRLPVFGPSDDFLGEAVFLGEVTVEATLSPSGNLPGPER